MNLFVNPFALILLVSGLATIFTALIIFKRIKQSEKSFAIVLGLSGWWALGYSAELFSTTYATMFFWLKTEYIGICLLPPTLFMFIRAFISSQKPIIKPFYALLFATPIITTILVWTNDYHHFYYTSLTVDHSGSFPVFKIKPAFWYYIFTAYFYAVIVWSIYTLATAFKNGDKIYQKQKNVILNAMVVPWVGNILYKFGISPNQNIDLTPFAFIITAFIISFGLIRYKLLDVIPAAREKIFESMQDGVLVLDTTQKVIDRNTQMSEILLLFNQKIIGASLVKLFPGNEKLMQGIADRKKQTIEIEIKNKQGGQYYEVDINILLDKSSDYNGCILIFHDITRRKKDALALEALNQLKDRLFSIIAHDLRSPLINITDMVKLIDDKVITEEEFRSFLPELSKNLNYTSSLLDNLLHWSKSQLKGESIHPVANDMMDIVEHEIVYFNQKAAEKGIKLKHIIDASTMALVDAEMIQLVIRNLIGNAIKFCKKNDSITVSTNCNDKNEVVVCVKDTGSGMKPGTVERLFMPDTFTMRGTNNEQGTGLGLQLCKDFIEKNNGKIWVTTVWGEGSSFCFTVPATFTNKTTNIIDKAKLQVS
jgi:PAS domain S-box-containing protein